MTAVGADGWPRPVRAWWAVIVFCLVAILSYTDRQILSLLVDPLRADLHITDTQVGILQGVAFAVVYSLAGLPLGRLADSIARRRLMIGGIALWSLATLACALSANFGQIFLARLFVGVGEAALAPAAVSMIADLFPPRRRGAAIGVLLAGMIIGGGVAIGAGGFLLEQAENGFLSAAPLLGDLAAWRSVLAFLGLAGVPAVLLMLTVREPVRRQDESSQAAPTLREAVRYFVANKGLLFPVILGLALMSVGDFSLLSWAPSVLLREYGYTAGETGALLGVIAIVTGMAGVLLGGALSDRLAVAGGAAYRLRLPVIAALAAVIVTPFGFLAASGLHVLIAFGWWMLFSSAAGAAGIAAVQALVPSRLKGLSIALISFGNIFFGLGIGATSTAWLADQFFDGPGAVALAISSIVTPCAVIALLLFAGAFQSARRQPALAREA